MLVIQRYDSQGSYLCGLLLHIIINGFKGNKLCNQYVKRVKAFCQLNGKQRLSAINWFFNEFPISKFLHINQMKGFALAESQRSEKNRTKTNSCPVDFL